MTPEELDAARTAAKGLHAVNGNARTSIADVFDAFLEHVDSQAEEIKQLEEDLKTAKWSLRYDNEQIERLEADKKTMHDAWTADNAATAARIVELEEALVEERAKHVAASRLTDEQRAAISRAIRSLEDPNYHHSVGEDVGAEVLRAMLEEGNP